MDGGDRTAGADCGAAGRAETERSRVENCVEAGGKFAAGGCEGGGRVDGSCAGGDCVAGGDAGIGVRAILLFSSSLSILDRATSAGGAARFLTLRPLGTIANTAIRAAITTAAIATNLPARCTGVQPIPRRNRKIALTQFQVAWTVRSAPTHFEAALRCPRVFQSRPHLRNIPRTLHEPGISVSLTLTNPPSDSELRALCLVA